jgi:ketosteroid isomerase-like protein
MIARSPTPPRLGLRAAGGPPVGLEYDAFGLSGGEQVDRASVEGWLQAYVDAWKTYDRDRVAALFAPDVRYRYHPYDDPLEGRDAVVASWLGEADFPGASTRDEPGTYEAGYRAIAVDGDVAVATGTTAYRGAPGGPVEKVFDNCFVIRFDEDGRCTEFTEWYVERPLSRISPG